MGKGLMPFANFPSGEIANRVLELITDLPKHKLQMLIERKAVDIRTNNTGNPLPFLSYKSLHWEHLDTYAELSGQSLRYILFGEHFPAQTYYSHLIDSVVIHLLDTLSPEVLGSATNLIFNLYHNSRLDIPMGITPSAKLLAHTMPSRSTPADVPASEFYKYTTDINGVLQWARQSRRKERIVYHIDFIPDLCTYFHVSPHWVFNLRGPLLCRTAEGDRFFDIFCLLAPHQQVSGLAILMSLCELTGITLEPEMSSRVEKIINDEGGRIR